MKLEGWFSSSSTSLSTIADNPTFCDFWTELLLLRRAGGIRNEASLFGLVNLAFFPSRYDFGWLFAVRTSAKQGGDIPFIHISNE